MKSLSVSANNIGEVLFFCKEALEDAGFENISIDKGSNSVLAETGISIFSLFGENIKLNIVNMGASNYQINVSSESIFQVIDWGKNEDNIDKIIFTIKRKLQL